MWYQRGTIWRGIDHRAFIYRNNQINVVYTTGLRLVLAQWYFLGGVGFGKGKGSALLAFSVGVRRGIGCLYANIRSSWSSLYLLIDKGKGF